MKPLVVLTNIGESGSDENALEEELRSAGSDVLALTVLDVRLLADPKSPPSWVDDLSNGAFWSTYVIEGEAGKGDICLNGPPARHFHRGDKVIIMAEAWLEPGEMPGLAPTVIFVDEKNQLIRTAKHPPTRAESEQLDKIH